MVDKKTITTAGIALIVGFMVSLGVYIADDSPVSYDEGYLPYTCDLENVDDYMCYKLSKVGTTGVNRNCYYDRDRGKKYKVCSTGWKRLINEDDYNTEDKSECPKALVIAYTDDGKYFCDDIGPTANCIKDNTIEMPWG